jgi:hypothetical protein
MRKFTFILPVSAILLAAIVLASNFGSPLSAQTPDALSSASAKDVDYAATDDNDVTAATWTETGIRNPDSRKPRLPQPKHAVKKAPKKK